QSAFVVHASPKFPPKQSQMPLTHSPLQHGVEVHESPSALQPPPWPVDALELEVAPTDEDDAPAPPLLEAEAEVATALEGLADERTGGAPPPPPPCSNKSRSSLRAPHAPAATTPPTSRARRSIGRWYRGWRASNTRREAIESG